MKHMDTDIEDLKQEVESLKAVTVDTNRIVHGMRRSQRWRSFVTMVWWLTILGITGATYFYLQPYINQAMQAYGDTKDMQVQVQDWFAQFGQTKTQ